MALSWTVDGLKAPDPDICEQTMDLDSFAGHGTGDAGALSHVTHVGEGGQNAMAGALSVPFALNVAKTASTRRRKACALLRE